MRKSSFLPWDVVKSRSRAFLTYAAPPPELKEVENPFGFQINFDSLIMARSSLVPVPNQCFERSGGRISIPNHMTSTAGSSILVLVDGMAGRNQHRSWLTKTNQEMIHQPICVSSSSGLLRMPIMERAVIGIRQACWWRAVRMLCCFLKSKIPPSWPGRARLEAKRVKLPHRMILDIRKSFDWFAPGGGSRPVEGVIIGLQIFDLLVGWLIGW